MPVADVPVADMPKLLNGRYRIERLLGIGGMGAVYRARDLLRQQFGDPSPLVAIKTLTDEFASYPDAYTLLHCEFVLTLRLNHPNVVRLHGFEVDNAAQRAYVVLELLQGQTLDQALAHQPDGIPWVTARDLVIDLLAAIAYAHGRGVLHGDIKPSNIMLTPDGLRLFDFGLGQAQAGVLDGLPRISRDRFTAWTPRYAALELIEGRGLSEATDTYAVACVIYELCTGTHPYRRLNAKQAKGLDLAAQLSPPKDMPDHCWQALRTALAFDENDRLISVQELARHFSGPTPSRLSMWFSRLRFA
ncbi:serine/threonine-protein kinase [Pseudomonas sp. Marseille-QA0892]